MKYTLYLMTLAIILFSRCETTSEIEIPVEPPVLVINSTLTDEDVIKVNVSQSQHILESGNYKKVKGATVEVYENGNFLTTLPDSLNGNYISESVIPKRGSLYKLIVSKDGFETASAEVILPLDTVPILSVNIGITKENSYGYESSYLKFSVEFEDDVSTDNFYNISIYKGAFVILYDYSVNPPVRIDSIYSIEKMYIESRDPGLEEFQSYGQNIAFNDELFNGKTYTMNVLASFFYDYENYQDYDYFVVLNSTSESYFLYELTSQLQYWTEDNPFAQPVTVYSNIENGLGILGAYNTSVFEVE